ncbi:MAG: 30S ribosomal protein S6 [Bdellovibrionales bacterium]
MPYYESIFIARQDIQSAQVEAITKEFEEIVKANGGAVKKTEQWGLRTLAYRIRKNKKGHYVLFNIDAPAAAIEEMERNMRLHEDILRYMTIKVDELEEGPSVMMRRDDQDGGERSSRRPLRQKADK